MPAPNITARLAPLAGHILVSYTHPFNGQGRTITVPGTIRAFHAWIGGELIQNAFPEASADQRECMISGLSSDEFDALWAESES